jgi:subtilisin
MAEEQRRSVIITFKRKDKRPEKAKDKLEIVQGVLSRALTFFDAARVQPGSTVAQGIARESVGFDVNEFEAPLVVARVSATEAKALEKDKNIESVEDDGLMYALGHGDGPAGLVFEDQPEVQAETVPAGVSQVKAPRAWETTKGNGIKVGVLDSGIAFDHPDLAANYKGGVSFVADESSPMDYNGHGTHCAGTIAAAMNGQGVVGVAPSARLYGIKVLGRDGSGNWSWLIAGLEWCLANGIHIASMSLGAAGAPRAVERMCDLAFSRGLLLIAAAGNDASPVGHPARYGSVIAVSANDSNNQLASFSNRGPEIELCAPGVGVLSTLPGGRYGRLSGTSMACPHVAGVAALAWSSHRWAPPGLAHNVAIRRLLAWTADPMGSPGRSPSFGFGRVDAERAAFELEVPPVIPGVA